jgi:hypothetical protein
MAARSRSSLNLLILHSSFLMLDLYARFRFYAQAQVARVLTQMDRDPDSPTFGCFDRSYWHYKIRDFPSAILQQGVLMLEAIRTGSVGWTMPDGSLADSRMVESWGVAAVNALARQVNRWGGVDEYYPFEQSYPAAAFGLYAVCRVLVDWQTVAPHLLTSVDWQPLQRLAQRLVQRVEGQAMNQQAAGLAGLALAAKLSLIDQREVAVHADRLLAAQHAEGWFYEYGGPDFGYLTVTLDALTDYFEVTQDQRAVGAIDRAIAFLSQLVGADGRLPSTLNCRNTDYVVPYGLVRSAARNPVASWLVETLFRDMDRPGHFLWATDDRYHCHYIFASIVRSLPYLHQMQPAQMPQPKSELWLEGCGYWVVWSGDRSWTAYVAARKGGLLRIHRRQGGPLLDHGWRIHAGKTLWTSNWWSDHWQVEKQAGKVTIRGRCQQTQFHVPTPLKHGALRLLSWLFGDKLIPLLKQQMIFRLGRAAGTRFERSIHVTPEEVEIEDCLAAQSGAMAIVSPRQNLRHVASADSFSAEEWQPRLIESDRQPLDRDLRVKTIWKSADISP